jgi:hypothetical protein
VPSSSGGDELLLEVFGVDPPTDEVTHQLYGMLLSRIAHSTVSIVSTLLQRKPLFKLTLADLEIVKPSNSLPSRSIAFVCFVVTFRVLLYALYLVMHWSDCNDTKRDNKVL